MLLGWETSATMLLGWETSATMLLGWETSATMLLGWETSATMLLGWETSATMLLGWETSATMLLGWETSAPEWWIRALWFWYMLQNISTPMIHVSSPPFALMFGSIFGCYPGFVFPWILTSTVSRTLLLTPADTWSRLTKTKSLISMDFNLTKECYLCFPCLANFSIQIKLGQIESNPLIFSYTSVKDNDIKVL